MCAGYSGENIIDEYLDWYFDDIDYQEERNECLRQEVEETRIERKLRLSDD